MTTVLSLSLLYARSLAHKNSGREIGWAGTSDLVAMFDGTVFHSAHVPLIDSSLARFCSPHSEHRKTMSSLGEFCYKRYSSSLMNTINVPNLIKFTLVEVNSFLFILSKLKKE